MSQIRYSGIVPPVVGEPVAEANKGGNAHMNKTELIQKIADEADGSKSEAQRFFDAFEGVVTSELKKGNQIQITGFG